MKADLATAGYISYTTKDSPDHSMVSLEAGQFHSYRIAGLLDLLGGQRAFKGKTAYIAGEYNYTDGAFSLPEHYRRFNLFGKYTQKIGAANKLSLNASAFSTRWVTSGEIPERAVSANSIALDDEGNPVHIGAAPVNIDRFAAVDSTQGGHSTRFNAIAKLSTDLKNNWTMENQMYYTHYIYRIAVF